MDKLEQYLDQVCRGIGGPKSLRQHVRQELREHIRDAAAEHKAAGLSDEAALDKALEDFGGPNEMRSELEATHGYRVMPVVIDKAMQWKEKTMRAKWLWTTWAYLAVAGVIVVNVIFFAFAQVLCIPKIKKIQADGLLSADAFNEPTVAWLNSSLRGLEWVAGHATWITLAFVGVYGLFEWLVRGENKPFVRLSALGSIGLALTIAAVIIAVAMVIPFLLGMPALRPR